MNTKMIPISHKNQKNWFNNLCAQSRSKFFINEPESKEHLNFGDNLISADECYTLIKRNMKRSETEKDPNEDALWNIPIILISLGCILVILMAFSFVIQCLVAKLRSSRIVEQFESDICNLEELARGKPKLKKKCWSRR